MEASASLAFRTNNAGMMRPAARGYHIKAADVAAIVEVVEIAGGPISRAAVCLRFAPSDRVCQPTKNLAKISALSRHGSPPQMIPLFTGGRDNYGGRSVCFSFRRRGCQTSQSPDEVSGNYA